MVNSIHVYGYQFDLCGERVEHRHHFLFVGDDAAVCLGKFGEHRTAAVYNDIIRAVFFHGFKDARFPFAVAHYINVRKSLRHQHIARHGSHHLAYLTETVMTRGAVDGQVAYCLALFNCFYICKTILHEGFLVLRLGVERDVFRQMLFHARFIMVNVVVCEQYHIHALGDFADGHYQMHPRTFIHAESGLQGSFVGKYGVNKDGVSCIIDFQGGAAHQPDNSFLVHNVTLL